MKVTAEYTDKRDLYQALFGGDYWYCITSLRAHIRSKLKYGELGEEAEKLLLEVQDMLSDVPDLDALVDEIF